MDTKPKGLFVLDEEALDLIYSSPQQAQVAELVDLVGPVRSGKDIRHALSDLAEVELMFSGWGAPHLDEMLLDAAPNLRMVFYGAGSVRQLMTEAAWQRGVRISSAYGMNAIPVAEFSVSQIVFCLKLGWQHVMATRLENRWERLPDMPGAYGSTVGIVALGQVGTRVCRMLQDYQLQVLAYDPYATFDQAQELGIELVALDDIFVNSDVVSLHVPEFPATHHMITGKHIASMKHRASLINTARGAIVDEPAMIEVLKQRADLVAVLDVTDPEPPQANSALWKLPNVVLLPHIAGSMDHECWRMGGCMVAELHRYLAGDPLEWEITADLFGRLA